MRGLNLGVHKLRPGGYRVAEPIWEKEDAERAEQGLPPHFDKYLPWQEDQELCQGPVQGGPGNKGAYHGSEDQGA